MPELASVLAGEDIPPTFMGGAGGGICDFCFIFCDYGVKKNMIYTIETKILSERARFLVKEKDKKTFTYMSLRKVEKLLDEKRELYSIGYDLTPNKILKIEFVGLQDFYEIKTFSGSRLYIGVDCELYIDGEWVRVEEVLFHEKLFYYDFLSDVFRHSYITKTGNAGNFKAFKVEIENKTGIIVNSLIVRFEGEEPEN